MKTMRTLTYFTRNDAPHPASYSPDALLPPRDTFADHPEVLLAYDEFTRLQAAMRENASQSVTKRQAADQAERDYGSAVAKALREGSDPAKIKQDAPRLRAEAAAHDTFASDSRRELANTSARLGRAIQQTGATLFPATEAAMTDAAERIELAVAGLRDAWDEWGKAWALRLHLSNVVNSGGSLLNYRPDAIPVEVRDALTKVSATLENLDVLKRDEGLLAAWRKEQAHAKAINERGAH